MGLAEKRAVAAYQNEKYSPWVEQINKVVGKTLEFDVNWESLHYDGYHAEYNQMFDFNYFAPLKMALENICRDDMGKSAFHAKIQKIKITGNTGWSSLAVNLDGNCLSLTSDPAYWRTEDAVKDYSARIVEVLEKNL